MALILLLIAAIAGVVVFIGGFARHGVSFLKYGFKQMVLAASLEKRFDKLDEKMIERIDALGMRLDRIEVNHFGRLKNFLTELTSILLDKGVINVTIQPNSK